MTAPASPFWRSQARRRLSVLCLYFGYGLAIALSAWPLGESVRSGLLVVPGLVAVFGLVGVLQAGRMLTLGASGILDERQRTVRDRAYYSAYRALGAVSVAGAVYFCLVRFGRIPAASVSTITAVLLAGAVGILTLTLPSAIMAWSEPDPPEDSGAYNMVNRSSFNPSPK